MLPMRTFLTYTCAAREQAVQARTPFLAATHLELIMHPVVAGVASQVELWCEFRDCQDNFKEPLVLLKPEPD